MVFKPLRSRTANWTILARSAKRIVLAVLARVFQYEVDRGERAQLRKIIEPGLGAFDVGAHNADLFAGLQHFHCVDGVRWRGALQLQRVQTKM